jgi:hypothetical protein
MEHDEGARHIYREIEKVISAVTVAPVTSPPGFAAPGENEQIDTDDADPPSELREEHSSRLAQLISIKLEPETKQFKSQVQDCYDIQADTVSQLMALSSSPQIPFCPHFILFSFDLRPNREQKSTRGLEADVEARNTGCRTEGASRVLEALGIPVRPTRDTVKFAKGRPRMPGTSCINNRTSYSMSTVTVTLAWSYCQETGSTVGMISHWGPRTSQKTRIFLAQLSEHCPLIGAPMLPALLFLTSNTLGTEKWFDIHVNGIMKAAELTGYHHNLFLRQRVEEKYDPTTEIAKVNGIAVNIATNHNCWEGYHGLALFALDELSLSSQCPPGADPKTWDEGLNYLRDYIKTFVTKATSFIQESASWQHKASIQVQGLLNLVSQREQQLSIQLAKDSVQIGHMTGVLAQQSLQDSASMKAIATVTMFFLPGTFVASLFAVPVFRWNAVAGSDIINHRIWVYWVVTLPLTLFTFGVFLLWDRIRHPRAARRLDLSGALARSETPQSSQAPIDEPP